MAILPLELSSRFVSDSGGEMSRKRAIVLVDLRPCSRLELERLEHRIGEQSVLSSVLAEIMASPEVGEVALVSDGAPEHRSLLELAKRSGVDGHPTFGQTGAEPVEIAHLVRLAAADVGVLVAANSPQFDAAEVARLIRDKRNSEKPFALFIADAGGEIGFGHLMRCRELALQLTERTGREAVFLVDHLEAALRIEERGLRAEWGAFERQPREAPDHRPAVDAVELARFAEYVVLDLFGKRELSAGWRRRLNRNTLVLDRAEPWCGEADLIVIPGVTFPEEWTLPMAFGDAKTPLLGGSEFVILRREIAELVGHEFEREYDILAYLYADSERDALRNFALKHSLNVRILAEATDDFAELLARSRLFISGFGITFYEALALGTRPVVWPLSDQHERDALRFFDAVGLAPILIHGPEDLDPLLEALHNAEPAPDPITDGTFHIVEHMERALSLSLSEHSTEEVAS